MLKSKKRWSFGTTELEDDQLEKLPVTNLTKKLLVERGVTTEEEAEAFLYPSLEMLISPKNFKDIEKTATRIKTAIEKNEKILIYGDYDADGVTSVTLLIDALERLGAQCDFYIPNRFSEGYGPNETAFRKAKEKGFSVIITVDNGIGAIYEAEVAKKLNIDLIITDHHEIQDELPQAFSIIHPKLSPNYEFKELAGVGVAFKLAEYLLGYFPEEYLDLVAVGTVADMVPLNGENRILTKFGLKQLTNTSRPGFIALKKLLDLDEVTETNIGFLIGPRLNAVGRLQDATLAVDLLRSESIEEAEQIALEVDKLNQERQNIVSKITKEIMDELDKLDKLPNILILSDPKWNEGVLGIVASRLVNKYNRPAIVLKEKEEGILKGSARSIQNFDLFHYCMKAKDLFISFGGHAQAAGMSLSKENKEKLFNHLNEQISTYLQDEDFLPQLSITEKIEVKEMTEELVNEIELFRPFGMENEKPLFHIRATPTEIQQLGKDKNHLKFQFREENHQTEGIGFQMGKLFHEIAPETPVEIVGELNINEWNGFRKVQLIVQDMCINNWQLFDYRGKKISLNHLCKKTTVVIYKKDETKEKLHNFYQLHYDDLQNLKEKKNKFDQFESIVLCDFPEDLLQLQSFIKQVKPKRIYACFYKKNSSYFNQIPSYEQFKKIYALIFQRKTLNLQKEKEAILRHMNWSKDTLNFVLDVFYDLQFIQINGSYVSKIENPTKRPLESSKVYQKKIEERRKEEILYYSSYTELKQWFIDHCFSKEEEELLPHGL